jgi:hypothetical protein
MSVISDTRGSDRVAFEPPFLLPAGRGRGRSYRAHGRGQSVPVPAWRRYAEPPMATLFPPFGASRIPGFAASRRYAETSDVLHCLPLLPPSFTQGEGSPAALQGYARRSLIDRRSMTGKGCPKRQAIGKKAAALKRAEKQAKSVDISGHWQLLYRGQSVTWAATFGGVL